MTGPRSVPADDAAREGGATGVAALAVGAGLAFNVLFRPLTGQFDEYLALPITIETAAPGTYAPGDLLVQAGLRGPFHVYRAAAWLLHRGVDLDTLWYTALLLSLTALFAATFRLARAVGAPPVAAALATLLVAASPMDRGTLHWTFVPSFAFITSNVAGPLLLLAAALALEGRRGLALAVAALTFDLHPGLGSIALAVTGFIWLRADAPRTGRHLVGPAAAALLLAPALVDLLAGQLRPAPADAPPFVQLFRQFAVHWHPLDHFREGYAWFGAMLAAAWRATTVLPAPRRASVRQAVAVAVVLMVTYALVTALVPVRPLLLLYGYRATYLLKPLAFGLVATAIAVALRRDRRAAPAPVLALAATMHPNPWLADAAAFALLAVLQRLLPLPGRRGDLATSGSLVVALLMLAAGTARRVAPGLVPSTALDALIWLGTAVAVLGIALGWSATAAPSSPDAGPMAPSAVRRPGASPLHATVAMAVAFGAAAWLTGGRVIPPLERRARAALSRPSGDVGAVARWARRDTPAGSLFVVPPDTSYDWVPFRVWARRGMWGTYWDINQLAYDARDHASAVDRLERIGLRPLARRRVDFAAYDALPDTVWQALARQGATHAVVRAGSAVANTTTLPVVFRSRRWLVLALPRDRATRAR